MTDLAKRVAYAVGLIRSGTYRYLIVRWTGLTADQVSELIELERPKPEKPKPETARCSKTGDSMVKPPVTLREVFAELDASRETLVRQQMTKHSREVAEKMVDKVLEETKRLIKSGARLGRVGGRIGVSNADFNSFVASLLKSTK